MTDNLPRFEGKPVTKATIRVTKATSDVIEHEARTYHAGDELFVVLKARVTEINHKAEPDADGLVRIHTAEVTDGTLVNAGDVADLLEAAHVRAIQARDRASGQLNLTTGEIANPRGSLLVESDDPAED